MKKTATTTMAASGALLILASAAQAEGEINALVWCDHTDPALLEPFEQAHDVKVNVKEYEGTAAGLAILDQSRPGDWDVMVIDTVDVGRAVDQGLLAALPDDMGTADFFPDLVMADSNGRDGTAYAVTEKFGYNTIAYDKTKVDPADMDDLSSLWSDKYAGRIAVYDYYLPVLGLIGLEQGTATADLTAGSVEALRDRAYALKANARQVSDVVASQTALATGEVDILISGAECRKPGTGLDRAGPRCAALVPVDRGAGRFREQGHGDRIRQIHRQPRRSGASGDVIMLLGNASKPRGGRRTDR